MSRRTYRDSGTLDCKIYVGDLPSGASRNELEDAFNSYGYLKNVWVARNPPGFAFVEFDDPRDARDAVREMDGAHICGRRIRVEMSSGKSRRGGGGGGNGRGPPRRDMRNEKCYECGETGHFARDCGQNRRSSGGGGGSRRRGRSYSRSRSRSRSRSPKRRHSRSRSRSRSKSKSGSADRD